VSVWGLYSETRDDGEVVDYSGAPREVERLPPEAEVSPDGRWATVYRAGRAIAYYVSLGTEPLDRRRSRK
jgi:hypothetical protein